MLRSLNYNAAARMVRARAASDWTQRFPQGFSLTKITATIGPASEQAVPLQNCVDAGMNIMRVNCSHATYEEIDMRVKNLRQAQGVVARALDGQSTLPAAVSGTANLRAILLDTQGPEIRTGFLAEGEGDALEMVAGEEVMLTTDDAFAKGCTTEKVFVTFKKLPQTVSVGDKVLFDDGLIELDVLEVKACGTEVRCRIMNGGPLEGKRGVNLPGLSVDLPAMSDKDRTDIRYGIEHANIDFVAASFIRTAEGVNEVRDYVNATWAEVYAGDADQLASPPLIISKVENAEAMDNFGEILAASDGIMVARGDLGVEIPFEKVSTAQKDMVKACNKAGKPVIVATQMLESMQKNPRPTRAEVSDVANAVYDGADCVMLSGESAKGKYYQQAISTMKSICIEADHYPKYNHGSRREAAYNRSGRRTTPVTSEHKSQFSMGAAAVKAADAMAASCIICLTENGAAAKYVAQCRPNVPIVAFTAGEKVARQLAIYRGVYPIVGQAVSADEKWDLTVQAAKDMGFCASGDIVVLLGSDAAGSDTVSGSVLAVKVATVG